MSQTTPMPDEYRVRGYLYQTNRAALTPRQERRANKKLNLAEKRERIAKEQADDVR